MFVKFKPGSGGVTLSRVTVREMILKDAERKEMDVAMIQSYNRG